MVNRMQPCNGVVGKGVKFERIRRVTGYLVGSLVQRFLITLSIKESPLI